jgi:NAD-dependent dihydropyrimidine dehydrogenase PreA subunit
MPPGILPRKRFGDEPSGAGTPPVLPSCLAASGPGAPPRAIAVARCNRCGACLRLGCGAISDLGGEALFIDPAACVGGGICAPACRARAIG